MTMRMMKMEDDDDDDDMRKKKKRMIVDGDRQAPSVIKVTSASIHSIM
jgi:hypothetical protein